MPWNISKESIGILLAQKMDKLERLHFREVGTKRFDEDMYRSLLDKLLKTVEYICFGFRRASRREYLQMEVMNVLLDALRNTKKKRRD